MRRIKETLIALLLGLLIPSIALAGQLDYMVAMGGHTFGKSYEQTATLNADSSVGSGTATFTANRDSTHPRTYIDSSGSATPTVKTTTTSNAGAFYEALYDTTGLLTSKRGVVIEAEGKNEAISGSDMKGSAYWTTSGGWADTGNYATSPDGNNNYTRLVISSDTADKTWYQTIALSGGVANKTVTVSVFVKATSGNCNFRIKSTQSAVKDNYSSNFTATSETKRFSFTVTNTSSAGNGNQVVGIANSSTFEAADLLAWGFQVEQNPYATTYIPTTTAALTRNAEVLKYETAGNRSDVETVFYKFIPFYSTPKAVEAYLASSQTKDRLIKMVGSATSIKTRPNETDTVGAVVETTSNAYLLNTSTVFSSVYKHSSPYIATYLNGVANNTYTSADWTAPSYGTYFFIGSANAGTVQIDGIIQSVTIFGRALTAAEVATGSNIMTQCPSALGSCNALSM